MVREIVHNTVTEAKYYAEFYGLSSDTKPTSGLVNGSQFVEIDTGNVYLFNETASAWVQL